MKKFNIYNNQKFDGEKVYILNNTTCPEDVNKLEFCVQANTYFWASMDDSDGSIADMTIYENIEDIMKDYLSPKERIFYNVYEFEDIKEFCQWYLDEIVPIMEEKGLNF